MFLIDDLAEVVLEGMTDYINDSYLTSLQNYLRGIRLLYERNEITEEEFRRQEAKIAQAIKTLQSRKKEQPHRTLDLSII